MSTFSVYGMGAKGFLVDRPLNDYEREQRLDVMQPVSSRVLYDLSLVRLNSTFIECVDKWYPCGGCGVATQSPRRCTPADLGVHPWEITAWLLEMILRDRALPEVLQRVLKQPAVLPNPYRTEEGRVVEEAKLQVVVRADGWLHALGAALSVVFYSWVIFLWMGRGRSDFAMTARGGSVFSYISSGPTGDRQPQM